MSDDTDVVESLRALAAWLDPLHPEPDLEDRAAVRARLEQLDRAAGTLGDVAGWDAALLRRAVVDVEDDEQAPPGWYALVSATIRAEHMQEPLEVTAGRLASNALLGAAVAGDSGTPRCRRS